DDARHVPPRGGRPQHSERRLFGSADPSCDGSVTIRRSPVPPHNVHGRRMHRWLYPPVCGARLRRAPDSGGPRMRARWRLIPFLIAVLAVAQGAFALPLRYSTYTGGTTTIAAGPDGSIVSVTL